MAMEVTQCLVPLLLVTLMSTTFFTVRAQNVSEPVLDVSGKAVHKGMNYFALPEGGRGNGGGLSVSSIRNQTKTLVVSQAADESTVGVSLQFSPVNPKENTIRLSTDVNVKFTSMAISFSSTVWRINSDLIPQRNLVTVGGVEGNPGRETISNWFKIDKHEDAYKFVYCPGVCETCRPGCGDIGILVEGNKRVLFVGSDKPLKVKFEYSNSNHTVANPPISGPPSPGGSIPDKLPTLSYITVVMCIVICYLIKVV